MGCGSYRVNIKHLDPHQVASPGQNTQQGWSLLKCKGHEP
jgi:hypothetical protein